MGQILIKIKNIFKKRNKPEGFTLVEVVASLLILGIAVLGIMSLFPVGIKSVTNANDTATATMLAQLKISQILYGRPGSLLGTPASPGPLICWNGSSYEGIKWNDTSWDVNNPQAWMCDSVPQGAYFPFKDNPKFYWSAYMQGASISLDSWGYLAIQDLYRVDLYVFKKERLPTVYGAAMPAFAKFTFLIKLP